VPYLLPVCQGLLVVVFFASAASKLRGGQALRAFATSLTEMGLVRHTHERLVAAAIAGAEAVVVLLLVIPFTRDAGFAGAAVLLVVLSAGVARVLARGTARPCRCFGASSVPLSPRHLIRNILLTAVALAGFVTPAGTQPVAASIVALLGGALAGFLVTALDDVIDLFTPNRSEEARWRT